jgi:hypothetical protein
MVRYIRPLQRGSHDVFESVRASKNLHVFREAFARAATRSF